MAIGPVIRLLQAISNLTRSGAIKKVEDAYRLAQRELGDKFNQYQKQIKDAFDAGIRKQKSADIIPFRRKEGIESLSKGKVKEKGEVIETSFKPGKDKRGKVVEESPSQASGIKSLRGDETFDELLEMEKKSDIFEDTLEAAKKMQKQKNLETSPLMKRLEGGVESLRKAGQAENLTTGLTRTMAREILMKRGIEIAKGMDPIETFRKTFGQDVLGDVSNLADELIEMEAMGKTPRRLEDILEQEGMFDIKMRKEPPQGYTDEELAEIQEAIDQEDILLKFDPEDRKPNADGGLNYLMGM